MERVVRLETVVERIEKDLVEIKADGKSTRTTVIVCALALAGLIVAIWQSQLAQMANMLSAFQSGLGAVQATTPTQQQTSPTVIQVQPAPVTVIPAPSQSPPQR